MRVGTLPWLLRHEWRLGLRSAFGELYIQTIWMSLVIACIGSVVIIAVDGFSSELQDFRQHLVQNPDVGLWVAIAISTLFFEVTFFDNLSRLFAALEQSTGSDLLTSSPLSARRIFKMQFAKLFLTGLISNVGFLPYALCTALAVRSLQPIAGFAIITIVVSLLCNGLAMWVGLGLARWLGVKRAALVGRLIFLPLWLLSFTAIFNAFGIGAGAWEMQPLLKDFLENPVYGHESWLWLLAQVLLLKPQAILLTTLWSVGLTALSYRFLPTVFLRVMQQSQVKRRQSTKYVQKQFISGVVRSIFRKEWRILLRSPKLWSSTLTMIVFFGLLMLGMHYFYTAHSIAPPSTLVDLWALFTLFWAGFSTLLLVRICLIKDQSARWLGTAPIGSLKLRTIKLLSTLMFLWCVFIPAGVVIKLLNGPGILLIGFLIPITITQAILALWNVCPLDQAPKDLAELSFMGRDDALTMYEFLALTNGCSLAVAANAQDWLSCLLLVGLLIVIMARSYQRSRKLGDSLIPY
ncbi:MAG: hypothetical protein WA902_14645 [Thermosynechococcaceae cyanobacterium]